MFAKLIKFTQKKYFSKNLAKISQKLKKVSYKFFDTKKLTKTSQN
jgi:hypothetical protein